MFEGVEASGKSHHISLVAKHLKKKKINFIKLREPGGSQNSEKIRKIILKKKTKFKKETDLLLYLASRSENIDLINKYYKKKVILIDRFVDSTMAYQHYGMGINLNLIKKVNNFLIGNFKPNVTFLSIVNKTNMKKRLKKRVLINKYDNFSYSFYDKVQKGYLKISKNSNKYVILDSNKKSIKENTEKIIDKIIKVI